MKNILSAAAMAVVISAGASAQTTTNAFDFGANYGGAGEPQWTNGANAGFGFGAWAFSGFQNSGSAGTFIGDPAYAGITGMSTESFGLYAYPSGSLAWVNASRPLDAALQVGQTLSFQWGINWDGGSTNGTNGSKGFNLRVGGTEVVNVNNSGNADILFNGVNTGMGYGTTPMTWSFTYSSADTLSVSANDRDGSGNFSTNVTVGGGLTSFEIYADQLSVDNKDFRQPYFNDFAVTTVPEPSTYALLVLSAAGFGGYVVRRRRR